MPIFEPGRAIPAKSREWKFGSDWLSVSRVTVVTKKKKKENKKSKASQLWPTRGKAYNNRKASEFWESALFSG